MITKILLVTLSIGFMLVSGQSSSALAPNSKDPYYSNTTINPWKMSVSYKIDWLDEDKKEFGAYFELLPEEDMKELWILYARFPTAGQEVLETSAKKSGKINVPSTSGAPAKWFTFAYGDDEDKISSKGKRVWLRAKYDPNEGNPLPNTVLFESVSVGEKIQLDDRGFIQLLYVEHGDIPNSPSAEFLKAIPPKAGSNMNTIIISISVVVGVLALAIIGFVVYKFYWPRDNAETKALNDYNYQAAHSNSMNFYN
ncbi:hypothetical protein MP638_003858 [Amoeboaphelidium occidentale]|nr:hypothetical protein MP638_003858 [Amoeboaphelidium occidentale]